MKIAIILVSVFSVALCKVDLFEGDIVLDKSTQDIIDGKAGSAFDAKTTKKWPNAVIPYVFDAKFDQSRRRTVEQAIQEYAKHTCIKFVPRTNQKNYLRFFIGGGCYSHIGMSNIGAQDVSLGEGCNYKATAMHEMMHAAGFFHEQSRRDRDNYVTIYWNNIYKGMEYNFKKYSHGEADTLGEPYDLDSIMHYDKYSFSVNQKPTIVAKDNPERPLGQQKGFSAIDIRQLNKLYSCNGGGGTNGGCDDKNADCPGWARGGHCTNPKYAPYMKAYCCKSCKAFGL